MRTFLGNSDSVYRCKFSHRRVPPALSTPRYISRNLSNVSTETFIQLEGRPFHTSYQAGMEIRVFHLAPFLLHNTRTRTCDFFSPFRPCDVVSRKKRRRRRRRERNAIRINRQRRGQMVVDRGGARRKRDGMDNPTGP